MKLFHSETKDVYHITNIFGIKITIKSRKLMQEKINNLENKYKKNMNNLILKDLNNKNILLDEKFYKHLIPFYEQVEIIMGEFHLGSKWINEKLNSFNLYNILTNVTKQNKTQDFIFIKR